MTSAFAAFVNLSSCLPGLVRSRPVFYRETASLMYHPWAQLLAWVTAEMPWIAIILLVGPTVAYFLIGFGGGVSWGCTPPPRLPSVRGNSCVRCRAGHRRVCDKLPRALHSRPCLCPAGLDDCKCAAITRARPGAFCLARSASLRLLVRIALRVMQAALGIITPILMLYGGLYSKVALSK